MRRVEEEGVRFTNVAYQSESVGSPASYRPGWMFVIFTDCMLFISVKNRQQMRAISLEWLTTHTQHTTVMSPYGVTSPWP